MKSTAGPLLPLDDIEEEFGDHRSWCSWWTSPSSGLILSIYVPTCGGWAGAASFPRAFIIMTELYRKFSL